MRNDIADSPRHHEWLPYSGEKVMACRYLANEFESATIIARWPMNPSMYEIVFDSDGAKALRSVYRLRKADGSIHTA